MQPTTVLHAPYANAGTTADDAFHVASVRWCIVDQGNVDQALGKMHTNCVAITYRLDPPYKPTELRQGGPYKEAGAMML